MKATFNRQILINKYGSVEGEIRWNSYLEKQRKSHSLDGFIEKYGEENGKKKYEEKRQKMSYINSKKFYIDKYGIDDGEIKYLEWCKKQRDRNSLKTLIDKYGQHLGTERYLAVNKKKKFGHFYSKKSQDLFLEIESALENFCTRFKFPKSSFNKGELILATKNHVYKYDFCDLYKKKIIEFNGDLWHANPNIYKNENEKILGKRIRHIRLKDSLKIKLAQRNGYEVLSIWEEDYDRNKSDVLKICCDWLKS